MPVKKLLTAIFLIFLFLIVAFTHVATIRSDVYDESKLNQVNKEISDLTASLNQSISATRPLESQLKSLQTQIAQIKQQVADIEADVVTKKKDIDTQFIHLQKQELILNATIRDFYIKSYYNSPFLSLLSASSATELTRVLAYQKVATDEDKIIITSIAQSISDLQTKKKNLESEETRLTAAKADLDDQSAKLDKVVAGAKKYQSDLSNQIAQLSAQQQSLLAAKLSSLNIPQSAYSGQGRSCIDDRPIDPGFSPRFAFFTYGVPNRIGLNQYGALGRAKAGQNVEQILQAYYPGLTLKKDYDQGATINVDGNGSMNVEEYVKRIYEVPNSWGDEGGQEALKAQAVAARSYGLAHRNGICTTESCQVFKPGGTKGGNWDSAADATKGWVLVDGGGSPVSTQYSSTHGGYILNINTFDGAGGNPSNFSELNDRAYDKMSPWFYCDWGSRVQYNKTAWLKPEEVADIANVILLARKDSSTVEHLYQPDHPPAGKEVWDANRVKSELGSDAFNAVTDVSVSVDFGSGRATNITISGGGKNQSFGAAEFKDWFNLRAPENIQIVGPLYNAEKK